MGGGRWGAGKQRFGWLRKQTSLDGRLVPMTTARKEIWFRSVRGIAWRFPGKNGICAKHQLLPFTEPPFCFNVSLKQRKVHRSRRVFSNCLPLVYNTQIKKGTHSPGATSMLPFSYSSSIYINGIIHTLCTLCVWLIVVNTKFVRSFCNVAYISRSSFLYCYPVFHLWIYYIVSIPILQGTWKASRSGVKTMLLWSFLYYLLGTCYTFLLGSCLWAKRWNYGIYTFSPCKQFPNMVGTL